MSDRDELAALIDAHIDVSVEHGDHVVRDEGALADAILARWRLVPVEVPNPAYDAGPGAQCGECGHFACRHSGEACKFPRPPENPCDCRGFLWNDVRIMKPYERTMPA